jgi:crossover junction endodeoxyribonuclease RusA
MVDYRDDHDRGICHHCGILRLASLWGKAPMTKLEFTVYGKPQPQGSTKAYMPKGARFPVVTSDNEKLKPWRQQISGTAESIIRSVPGASVPMLHEAVEVRLQFYFDKPKSTKKSVIHKITKPDIDKLERAVFDALTGIAFKDDAQVVKVSKDKLFGLPERVEIGVYPLGESPTQAKWQDKYDANGQPR